MICQEMQNLIPAYLAEALELKETAAVRAHLAGGCPRCAAALAEAEASLAMLPLSLVPVKPAPHVRARILQNLGRSPRDMAPIKRTPVIRWGLAAAVILLVVAMPAVMGVITYQRYTENQRISAKLTALESRLATLNALGRTVEQLQQDKQALTQRLLLLESPAVSVISLKGTEPQPKALARVFWDTESGVYRFSVHGLAPLAENKTYALWFITDKEEKIPVGTFNIRDGRGEITAQVPANIGRVALAAITDEPAGGSPQPTGTIQMVGKLAD